MLPAAAPTAAQLEGAAKQDDFNYSIVRVDPRVVSILHRYSGAIFGSKFKGPAYIASNVIRAGDVVSFTIYESGGPPLFGAPPIAASGAMISTSNTAGAPTIPPQTVEADGTVFMPFVGKVAIAGRSPVSVGRLIEERLAGKAANPQVVVSTVGNVSQTATVGGDVNQPRPVPLSLRGERLLDVIAMAGGSKFPSYETFVRVVRGQTVGQVLLQTIEKDPSENIVVRPSDQISLTHNIRTFAVLGATQKVSQYTFDTEKVTLTEAVARAGGPIETVGDPRGVYLFRFEPWSVANEILSASGSHVSTADAPEFFPLLYRIDLTRPDGIFLAQSIQLRDKDVVLITNAEATELMKLLTVIRGFTGVAYDLKRWPNN